MFSSCLHFQTLITFSKLPRIIRDDKDKRKTNVLLIVCNCRHFITRVIKKFVLINFTRVSLYLDSVGSALTGLLSTLFRTSLDDQLSYTASIIIGLFVWKVCN